MSLTAADEAVLARWIGACRQDPSRAPEGVRSIQARLVRWVGRGRLPDAGDVFLKVMGFPRFRDRIRYVHRDLPARHEARMLERVASAGIAAPVPLLVHTERSLRLPRLSVLVTAALRTGGDVTAAAALDLAARMADIGLFHPDLNPGNFLALADGTTAVLDLQSARWLGRSLDRDRRLAMASKLLLEFADLDAPAIGASGLVRPADSGLVADRAAALAADARRRRLHRCLTSSTEFVVERRWNGRVHWRRADRDTGGSWLAHDRARALWLGDRAAELLGESSPKLAAMFAKAWWFPGRDSVKIRGSGGINLSALDEHRMVDAIARYRGGGDAAEPESCRG